MNAPQATATYLSTSGDDPFFAEYDLCPRVPFQYFLSPFALEFLGHEIDGKVDDQNEHEQNEPRGEQCRFQRRAGTRFAHFHDDVGRERADVGKQPLGEERTPAGDHVDRHGLAHRPADAEDERGNDTRTRGGQDDVERRLRLGVAERKRALHVVLRHRFERVFTQRCHRRQDHDGEHEGARQDPEAGVAAVDGGKNGNDDGQTEITVNDGRNARKEFDDLIEKGAQIDLIDPIHDRRHGFGLTVIAKIQLIGTPEDHKAGSEHGNGAADGDGQKGHDDAVDEHGQNAVYLGNIPLVRILQPVVPERTEQKVEYADIAESGNGRIQNVPYDTEYGNDRHARTENEEDFCACILNFCLVDLYHKILRIKTVPPRYIATEPSFLLWK